jgi:mannose-1-phosphate guanylyltransferase
MRVMFLAAGEGRRLQPYTLSKPKPAIPFLTAPLVSFSLALLEKINIRQIVVNTHHLPQQVENLFHWSKLPTKNLVFSPEHEQLLDSGGGIHKARPYLYGEDSFLVINADEIILPHGFGLLQEMIQFHNWHKGIATLLTMDHPGVGTQFGGAWTDEGSNEVKMFSKTVPQSSLPLKGHHYIGVMLLHPRVFDFFKPQVEVENILYHTLTKAIEAGEKVRVFNAQCEWFETGNPKSFLEAASSCIEALEKTPDANWVQSLAQTLRVYGEGQLLIENQNPDLVKKIEMVFARETIRLDSNSVAGS